MKALNVITLCFLAAITALVADAQRNPGNLDPGNLTAPAVGVLFGGDILTMDTPIAIRYALMFSVVNYNVEAACQPVALNFWGERDALPESVCKDKEAREDLGIYGVLRTIELEFPDQAKGYADLMRENGFDPDNRSTDKSTGIGFGNAAGIRVARWFAKDGWNSLGDKTRDNYLQPYEDFSNYGPVNSADRLKFPLRWQPLTQGDGLGRFTIQKHVVPYLGTRQPLALTKRDIRRKKARSPYRRINAKRLGRRDAQTLDKLIEELFSTSAKLTNLQRVLARFWENKFISLGVIGVQYLQQTLNVTDSFILSRWILGEMIGQHDAVILAWKEKRRIDAIRPKSAVRLRFAGKMVRAYVPKKNATLKVKADEWESLIPAQPHSEYPSASALICGASFEHAEGLAKEVLKIDDISKAPPVNLSITFVPFEREGIDELRFETLEDAADSCGISRLWAGVHFSPSIPAGLKLSKNIGTIAYEHVRDLANGKIPENCVRCSRK